MESVILVQILDEDVCVSLRINAFGKELIHFFSSGYLKIIGQATFLSLDTATSLGDENT